MGNKSLLLIWAAVLAACSADGNSDARGAAGDVAGGSAEGVGDVVGADVDEGGADGVDGLDGTGYDDGVPAADSQPPGDPVYDPAAVGSGPCAGVSVADVVAAIHAENGQLSDISELHAGPDEGGDGSFVFAFARPDGGFALVLQRGWEDCEAGCAEHEYWYFTTGADCAPEQVGHYYAPHDTEPSGKVCLAVEGAPMWQHPPAPSLFRICGADLTPQDISGEHEVQADGQHAGCAARGSEQVVTDIDGPLTLVIEQDASDLGQGTVTVAGTGLDLLEGVAWPATFERQRLRVASQEDNLPSDCPMQHDVSVIFDFEKGLGYLSASFVGAPDCTFCKGHFEVGLSAPAGAPTEP